MASREHLLPEVTHLPQAPRRAVATRLLHRAGTSRPLRVATTRRPVDTRRLRRAATSRRLRSSTTKVRTAEEIDCPRAPKPVDWVFDSALASSTDIIVGLVAGLLTHLRRLGILDTGLRTVSGILTFAYFVAVEVTQGRTLGKMILGPFGDTAPGGAPRPSVQQSAIRNAFTCSRSFRSSEESSRWSPTSSSRSPSTTAPPSRASMTSSLVELR